MKMRKQIFILSTFILLMGILSCGEKAPEKKTESTTNPVSTNATGEDNYKKFCVACHGADGDMGMAGAKSLPKSALSQQEREDIISNGKGTMPGFNQKLDPEAIKKVAEYTLTLK